MPPPITYEAQHGARSCAAAALAMAYRALGQPVAQTEIWKAIAVADARGAQYARTHRMALDAARRGFAAVAFRVREPRAALAHLQALDAVVVLNHRLAADSPLGHFSILAAASAERLVRHDPHLGPAYEQPLEEFVALWQHTDADAEITGRVCLVIDRASPATPAPCRACGRSRAGVTRCPACAAAVTLSPGAALGCTREHCRQRLWEVLICPACDAELPAPLEINASRR